MGTRSAIGIAQGDGWKARYAHWDGYPSGVGTAILKIHADVCEGDWEKTVNLLTEQHTVWSTVNAEGHAKVSGVGDPIDDLDEWIEADGDNWGTEWAYVLTAAGITVLHAVRNGQHAVGAFGVNAGAEWEYVDLIKWDEPAAQERMAALG